MSPSSTPSARPYPVWTYFAIVLAVLLTYANTLGNGFVWDDNLFAANQAYWHYDFRTIFFSLANGLEYQPVRDLSFMLDIAIWGDRPWGFHLTNLVLFCIVALLVYRLAARLHAWCRGGSISAHEATFVPLATALLFALHPLRSEVVAWVTQRNTLLSTLFCLLSIVLFCRYLDREGGRGILLGSIAAFVLAIFSKAIVVILPLLLLLLATCRKGGRLPWLSLFPFFIVSASVASLHVAIARKTSVISSAYGGSLSERLATALQIPAYYLRKTLLPTDLSSFYPDLFNRSLAAPAVLYGAALLMALATASWLLRRRLPEFGLGFGWFIITLLPVSNLFATSPVVADRYTFLPAIGLCFTAAAILGRLGSQIGLRRGIYALLALVLLACGVTTYYRNSVWKSDISLWSDTVQQAPFVAGVWYNLGRAWHRTTRLGLALDAYLRAARLDPSDERTADNAAALIPSSEGTLGQRKEMVAALAGQMPAAPAGLALIGQNDTPWSRPEVAEALFMRLLQVDTESVELRLALANLYLKLGEVQRAKEIYSDVRQSGAGKGEAEFGLARIAASSGNSAAATELVRIARQKGGVPETLLQTLSK